MIPCCANNSSSRSADEPWGMLRITTYPGGGWRHYRTARGSCHWVRSCYSDSTMGAEYAEVLLHIVDSLYPAATNPNEALAQGCSRIMSRRWRQHPPQAGIMAYQGNKKR